MNADSSHLLFFIFYDFELGITNAIHFNFLFVFYYFRLLGYNEVLSFFEVRNKKLLATGSVYYNIVTI